MGITWANKSHLSSTRGAGFDLLGYGLELVAGDADFADELDGELSGAGVVELGGSDGGVGLRGGRERGAEVGSFLHRVEDGVADFCADHFAERTGAEELAERAVGLDVADFGIEAKLRLVLLDGGSQADGHNGVAGDDVLGLLFAKSFHTGKTFVVELHRCESGGRRGCECGLLDRNALAAAVVFVELGGEEWCEVFLQAGEVGGESQAEGVGGRRFGDHRDRGGREDVGLLVFDGEGNFLRGDAEDSVLRGENCRESRKQDADQQSPPIKIGFFGADATRNPFPLGKNAHPRRSFGGTASPPRRRRT
jgi:hypothetical protein